MYDDPRLRDAILREHLFFFTWKVFATLHPNDAFARAWHVEALCHALTRVAEGKTLRLLVTVPPRHLKSICTAVALPAWLLGRDPSLKIMVASYGADLATKHARDFRAVLASDWYRALFPRTRLISGGNREDEQTTSAHGTRKSVSLGGAATGFGADLIIVDDLMKASEAASPVERERVHAFYEQTLLSRLNDKRTGRIIAIQQRLHEDDLAGHLIVGGQFEHLNLPAIATEAETIAIGFGRTHQRANGEALCPEREPLAVLERFRREMGAFAFSSQYQQDPTPEGGNRFRWDWFGTYASEEGPETRNTFQYVVQSWDTALTDEPTSDYSVGLTWGFRDARWHLLDLTRERHNFPELKSRVQGLARRWNADCVLIEQAASGIPLRHQLNQEDTARHRIYVPVIARDDKRTRAEAQTARLAEGRYLIPEVAPWLTEFRRELLAFPNGRHDDQVDALVQFVEWSASPNGERFVRRDSTGRPLGRERR